MSNEIQKSNEKAGDKLAFRTDFADFFVRVYEGHVVSPVKANMTLTKKAGHLYSFKGSTAITAPGYRYLNKVASINLITPKSVAMGGQSMPNPHVERDPRTKAIQTVNIRKMAIGFSPAGNITVIDKTLYYNIYTYFLQSIQAKMSKKYPKDYYEKDLRGKLQFPDCARYGSRVDKPTDPEGSKWAFYGLEPPLGIWVNYVSPGIIACLEDHVQRQRFGDRIAQTIVERNLLSDHPAIAVKKVDPQGSGDGVFGKVTIWGYRHDFDASQISDVVVQAEKGSKEIKVEAEVINGEVDVEEEEQAISEVAQEDDPTSKAKPDKGPQAGPFRGGDK